MKLGVEQARSLDFIGPVQAEFLSSQELTVYVDELLGEDEREELIQLQGLLAILELVDEDLDLVALYRQLLSENVLGAYDAEDNRLVVRLLDEAPSAGEESTLAHELTHALQQQHFDINSLLVATEGNFDGGLAVSALVEGDATLSELRYMAENSLPLPSVPDTPVYDNAPPIIQELLLFPYLGGLTLLANIFEEEGWPGIDDLYRNPPQSTEQMLHSERYLEGEAPLPVDLPDAERSLGPDWSPVYSSVGGEFLLRQYLASRISTDRVDEASDGWGGDMFALYEDVSGRRALLWMFRWDSVTDAEEFVQHHVALTERVGGWVHRAADNSLWGKPGRWLHLHQAGDYSSVIIAPSREVASKLAGLVAAP